MDVAMKHFETRCDKICMNFLVTAYLEAEPGNSINTWKAKKNSLAAWLGEFELLGVENWEDVDLKTACKIRDKWRGQYSQATISIRVTYLRHFAEWVTAEYGMANKLQKFANVKPAKRAPKKISNEDVASLLIAAKADNDEFLAARNYALLLFLFETGSRRSETMLTWGDLELEAKMPKFEVYTKGNKTRIVYLSPTLVSELKILKEKTAEFLAGRYEYVGSLTKLPLFISSTGRLCEFSHLVLSGDHIGDIFQRVGARAKVKCTPHQARHTYAYNTLSRTNDLLLVSKMLGHSTVSVTEKYLERTEEEIFEALNFESRS